MIAAAFLSEVQAMAQSNTFVVEEQIQAIPLDLEVTPNGKLAAADMALTTDGANVVLRLSAPMVDSGTPGGVDWSRFHGVSLPATPAVGDSFGGQGECVAADSLRVARSKAVSISQDTESETPAGWIHIVKAQ